MRDTPWIDILQAYRIMELGKAAINQETAMDTNTENG
jgi:hypothetical protein